MNIIKVALNYFRVVKTLNDFYPKSKYKMAYLWSPFDFSYQTFALVLKNGIAYAWNPDTGNKIYENIKIKYPDFIFENKAYDEERLREFICKLGYECPEEKVLRYVENPFTKERVYINYDENGKVIKNK